MAGYVYETRNLITGKRYIGKKVSPVFVPEYLGSGTYINHAINKHGRLNFSVRMIEQVFTTREELAQRERYWIAYYRSINAPLYNLTAGGDGGGVPRAELLRVKKEAKQEGIMPKEVAIKIYFIFNE